MLIEIINGPNLNLLGIREPEVYGTDTLADIERRIRAAVQDLNLSLTFTQSNSEGGIIDALQAASYEHNAHGIVLNAGAYAHYSLAIHDAITALVAPVVEVHLSNTLAREAFRHRSVLGSACRARIEGMGWQGYAMAVRFLAGI